MFILLGRSNTNPTAAFFSCVLPFIVIATPQNRSQTVFSRMIHRLYDYMFIFQSFPDDISIYQSYIRDFFIGFVALHWILHRFWHHRAMIHRFFHGFSELFIKPFIGGLRMNDSGERTPQEHPIVVIGAGHIGLRQAEPWRKPQWPRS